jgi:hypothetical protein
MIIKEYLESGVLESYVLGAASEAEIKELLLLKKEYPQIQNALAELEADLERIARHMAVPPSPGMLTKIENSINELTNLPVTKIQLDEQKNRSGFGTNSQFIEVEAESNYIRVHKNWKWVFIAVFILSKIFLIAAIYFYLESRQAQQQIQELKSEIERI